MKNSAAAKVLDGALSSLLTVTVPLVAGGTIYILWRPRNILIFRLLDEVGMRDALTSARRAAQEHVPLKGWAIFSLPTALWAFSFLYCMLLLWRGRTSKWSLFWIALAVIVVESSEFAQKFGIIPGTFDIQDVMANSAGLAAAILVFWARESVYGYHA